MTRLQRAVDEKIRIKNDIYNPVCAKIGKGTKMENETYDPEARWLVPFISGI